MFDNLCEICFSYIVTIEIQKELIKGILLSILSSKLSHLSNCALFVNVVKIADVTNIFDCKLTFGNIWLDLVKHQKCFDIVERDQAVLHSTKDILKVKLPYRCQYYWITA